MNNNLFAQVSQFANESLTTYLVGIPIIFAILLLVYGIFKLVFAGASKTDREHAQRLLWVAVIMIIVVIVGYTVLNWAYSAMNPGTSLPGMAK